MKKNKPINSERGGVAVQRVVRRRWRIWPIISYTNWKKERCWDKGIWTQWLSIRRSWGGRIIHITIKHHDLCLDFRYSWLDDMRHGV